MAPYGVKIRMKTVNLFALAIALAVTGLLAWFALRPPHPAPAPTEATKMSADAQVIVFGMGCFWGAEKRMGAIDGVLDVESGYANGDAPKVGYEDVLGLEREIKRGRSQARNHAEVEGDLRPEARGAGDDPRRVLGEPRPDPGRRAGQRHRHQLSKRHLHHLAGPTRAGRTDP